MTGVSKRIIICALIAVVFGQKICLAVDAGCCDSDAPNIWCSGMSGECDGCTNFGDCGGDETGHIVVKEGGVDVCVGTEPYDYICTRPTEKVLCYTLYECGITGQVPLLQCLWLGTWFCGPTPNVWCNKCGPLGTGLFQSQKFDYTCQDDGY